MRRRYLFCNQIFFFNTLRPFYNTKLMKEITEGQVGRVSCNGRKHKFKGKIEDDAMAGSWGRCRN
jgi:hypothetical protein